MLQNLSEEIRECYDRAEKWAQRAAWASDRKLRAYYLEREQRWLQLAQSYELSERLIVYCNEATRRVSNGQRQCKLADKNKRDWHPISIAPFARDLRLAFIDHDGAHVLAFPCQRVLRGWVKSESKIRIDIAPTHWRD